MVGHDSGGMIARHAMAGDERLAAMGLIDTEQPQGMSWRFKMFLAGRKLPGFGATLGWLAGQPRLRRNGFVLGDAFVDRSLLDGEFDEFFLRPIATDPAYRAATMKVLRSFEPRYVHELGALHRRIDVPVQLVWGEQDKFFPVEWAREMVADLRRRTAGRGAGCRPVLPRGAPRRGRRRAAAGAVRSTLSRQRAPHGATLPACPSPSPTTTAHWPRRPPTS